MKNVKDCRVIAHRGASAYCPENTMPAFRKAIEMNSDMIELDITMTSDKEIVIIHDETVDRTTNGKGKVIDYSFDDLSKFDAGNGEKIPTLDEFLKEFSSKIPMNIEIKTEAVKDELKNGIEEKCIDIVCKYDQLDNIIISSFDPRAIRHVKQLDENIKTAYLYEKKWWNDSDPLFIVRDLGVDAFNCEKDELTDEWIDTLSSNNIDINIYTVDDPLEMRNLFKRGVHGIFSNKPDILLKEYHDFISGM